MQFIMQGPPVLFKWAEDTVLLQAKRSEGKEIKYVFVVSSHDFGIYFYFLFRVKSSFGPKQGWVILLLNVVTLVIPDNKWQ